ncbi:hypothetical protein [uncultured Paracoccus sp.]|nr:hypothetical protein [uncultured Paracoccus sp.]
MIEHEDIGAGRVLGAMKGEGGLNGLMASLGFLVAFVLSRLEAA